MYRQLVALLMMPLQRYCALCGIAVQDDSEFCESCQLDLPILLGACPRCAIPLGVNMVCTHCLKQPPPYERSMVLFHYTYPIDSLLKAIKFGRQLGLASQLGRLMAKEFASQILDLPDCLIPVPLHWRRMVERGYNQSLELARPIAKRLALPLNLKDCRRVRHTAPQSQLSLTERRVNVKAAFAVRHPLEYRHVAIVDDVITTGSTVAELSSLLLKAGVKRVEVWACARATKQ